MSYTTNYKEIEQSSKQVWEDQKIYQVHINKDKEKEVILDFFPYPSGVGLHVGHTLGYIATDVYSRFKRLKGKNVLHAMGYDAFGLPAEQFAIENKQHPSVITYKNIENIKAQLKNLGLDHDEERTFNTTDVDYYKWTQDIFLKLYNSYYDDAENKVKSIDHLSNKLEKEGKSKKEIYQILQNHRLAYLDEIEVNWCPKLGTVLSNEEVIGGLSERGSCPVIKKPLRQWMFRITKLAERLIENLEKLDWPLSVKEMQRNWIGLSYGHEVSFECSNGNQIKVYTTRLDTLNGVTFCAISKDHKDIKCFYQGDIPAEDVFDGILTNVKAKHPITGLDIPIYVADYVLSYGTGAVMGVPAHDERDYEFAKKNNIKVLAVVKPNDSYFDKHKIQYSEYMNHSQNYPAFSEKNKMLNGKITEEEISFLETHDFVKKQKYMKLRDWVFSRQRYWGEPFPIILDEEGNPYALEASALPIELPYIETIRGEAIADEVFKPLDDCKEWKEIQFIKLDNYTVRIVKNEEEEANGSIIYKGVRETNTMPNWAGSCWYYLRYMDNKNNEAFIGEDAKNYWEVPKKIGAIDLYLGGAEHAVLHLLYARFWHIALYDLGFVNSPEPFQKLFNQGMILGPSYQNEEGKYFHYLDIKKERESYYSKSTNEKLIQNIGKIGKRYKNGVTPEEVCDEYSIDGLRMFMMYLGPLDQSKPWDHSAIKGMVRVLDKVYSLKFNKEKHDSEKEKHDFNEMLKKIEVDFQNLKFNTAIAAYIIFLNTLNEISYDLYKKMLIILAPLAPHLAEYLYQKNIKEKKSIVEENWPESFVNINYFAEIVNLVISINGKKKEVIEIPNAYSKEQLISFMEGYCNNNSIKYKKIVIPARRDFWFVNIVLA